MRWRMVDRITGYRPWRSIAGRKVVSLEEYSLLERFGHNGEFPETLVLESTLQLARWLVMKSSDFLEAGIVSDVNELQFHRRPGMGSGLDIRIKVEGKLESTLHLSCACVDGEGDICEGRISLAMMPLTDIFDPDGVKPLWKELYGEA